jgi:hypothetical protein
MKNLFFRDITLNGLAPSIIEEDENGITYFGYCKFNCSSEYENAWAIKRIQTIGNITYTKWAEGSVNFNLKWSDRKSYSYKFAKF